MLTITLDRPSGVHSAAGLSNKSLTGLCRGLVAAGVEDGPAVTHDGTMTCMRLASIHRYARLSIHEGINGGPLYTAYVPFEHQRFAPDRDSE
jgi:hypothetical protein